MSARSVALVGLRCSGKSSVGRALAELLGWPFVDLDEVLARLFAREQLGAEPLPAGAVLERLGEEAFRALEQRALEEVLARAAPLVLATGGGVVEREPCRELLRARCTCVWLRAEPAVLRRRMAADATPRPSLTGAGAAEEIEALARRRASLYADLARYTVASDEAPVESIARRVRALLLGAAPPG